ncbi:MAG TPA: hypothetical protein EYP10_07890, partial [Armatimonadetes bacterium]|nr:hypothetical protein [Armatimonadota bacterium]
MILYRSRLATVSIALFASVFCFLQLPSAVHAGEVQEGQVLFSQDFEADQGQWLVIGAGQIKWVRGEGRAHSGQGALEFTYPVAKRGLIAAVTPITPLPGARSVRCWVKPNSATVLIFATQESDGSRYMCPFYAAGGKWQHIVLNLSDFILMPDTSDENARLDPEQLIALGLLDAATLFQLPSAGEQKRTVLLDDLVISTAQVESRAKTVTEGNVTLQVIDDFENPTLFWAPIRLARNKIEFDSTAELAIERDAQHIPYGTGALRYKYAIRTDVAPALTTFLFKPIQGAVSLRLSVKAEQPTALLIGVSERDDSQYQTFVYVAPNKWHDVRVSLDELMLAEDSSDENGKLDLDQVQSVYIADMGALFARFIPSLVGARTIWLDRIAFSSQEEPPAQGITEEDGQQLVWIDTCESSALRWVPLQITMQPLSIDLAEDVTFKREEHEEGIGQGRYHLRVEYVT